MESQPQNPEFRNNPENFHTCNRGLVVRKHVFGVSDQVKTRYSLHGYQD